jgi:hypothetical protein
MKSKFGRNKYSTYLNVELESCVITLAVVITAIILGVLFRYFGG